MRKRTVPEGASFTSGWRGISSVTSSRVVGIFSRYVPVLDAHFTYQGCLATFGRHDPDLGHSVWRAVRMAKFFSSHNQDRKEEVAVFVLRTQWLEPKSAGWNIGDMYVYVVPADGFESLSRPTPLETHRSPA